MKKLFVFLCILSSCVSLATAQHRFSKLFEKVGCSVVVISVEEKQNLGVGDRNKYVTSSGLGSGVIISEEGYIMTAAHVVQTAERIRVKLEDGRAFTAKVIGSSTTADVALIQLFAPPNNLCVSGLADSDKVKIGDEICIIGAPYGLTHSLSVGYISGRHARKSHISDFNEVEFFQTDAAINRGNSGGPMFNEHGEVIGIISYILSESGGFEGLGFAATANVAKHLLIDEPGYWTGVDGILLTGRLAQVFNIPQEGGFLIQKVAAGSPADVLGLQGGDVKIKIEDTELLVGGDILLSVNNIPATNAENTEKIGAYLRARKPGDKFPLKILRSGKVYQEDAYVLPK